MRRLPVLPAIIPSASHAALAQRCVYPWTSGARWPARDESGAAVGTAVHGGAEMSVRGVEGPMDLTGFSSADARTIANLVEDVRWFVLEERLAHHEKFGVPHRVYAAEVAVAYDLSTGEGRYLAPRTHRDYAGRADTAIAGTIDHLLWPFGGPPTVRDWKTGRQRGIAAAASNLQVGIGALAVASILGVDEVAVEVAHLDEATGVSVDRAALGPLELSDVQEQLLDIADRLGAGPTPPRPGAWCTELFCPLRGACPATMGALAAVVQEPMTGPVIADNETALRAIDFLRRAELAVEALRGELHNYIQTVAPVQGPDGRLYGMREQEVRRVNVDTPDRMAALLRVLGEDLAAGAVEIQYKTSLGAIERAVRQRQARERKSRGHGALMERALAELAAVGGVSVSRYWKPEWFRRDGGTGEGAKDLPTEGYDDERWAK